MFGGIEPFPFFPFLGVSDRHKRKIEAYNKRRKSKPFTQEECDALTTDLDPTGEIGLGTIDIHLETIDKVRNDPLLKRKMHKPNNARVKEQYQKYIDQMNTRLKEHHIDHNLVFGGVK